VIIKVTAQLVASKGSQIATSNDEKLGVGDIVFFAEPMQERCRGSVPRRLNTSTSNKSLNSVSIAA